MDLQELTNQPITWIVIVYILIKEVLPKLAPDFFAIWNKKISMEDRLFQIIEKNTEALVNLKLAVEGLALSIVQTNDRVDRLEDYIKDDGVADFIRWFRTLPAYRDLQKSEGRLVTGTKKTEPDRAQD